MASLSQASYPLSGAQAKADKMMILTHLPKTFRVRQTEWLFAIIMTCWGFTVFHMDMSLFGKFFGPLFEHTPPWLMATATFTTGIVRLTTLTVNGMWRRSPYLRAAMSALSGIFFIQIALGILCSGLFGTGWAVYLPVSIFEFFNVSAAMSDARAMDDKYAALKT